MQHIVITISLRRKRRKRRSKGGKGERGQGKYEGEGRGGFVLEQANDHGKVLHEVELLRRLSDGITERLIAA